MQMTLKPSGAPKDFGAIMTEKNKATPSCDNPDDVSISIVLAMPRGRFTPSDTRTGLRTAVKPQWMACSSCASCCPPGEALFLKGAERSDTSRRSREGNNCIIGNDSCTQRQSASRNEVSRCIRFEFFGADSWRVRSPGDKRPELHFLVARGEGNDEREDDELSRYQTVLTRKTNVNKRLRLGLTRGWIGKVEGLTGALRYSRSWNHPSKWSPTRL